MALLRSFTILHSFCSKELGHIPWRRTISFSHHFKNKSPLQAQSYSKATYATKVQALKVAERHLCSTVYTEKNSEVEDEEVAVDTQDLAAIFSESEMSNSQWEDLIHSLSKSDPSFNEVSCDALIMRRCLQYSNYALGTSYMNFIKHQGKMPNLATLSLYLRLCSATVSECGEERVLEVYHGLISQAKVLDANLSESAILGLSSTREWRQALKHLSVIKKMCNVSSKVYSAIVAAAFRNNDHETGWHYLDLMCQEEKVPLDHALLEWMKQCKQAEGAETKQIMIETLLRKLVHHDLFPKVPVIKNIADFYKEGLGGSSLFVRMPRSGKCPACHQQLTKLKISEEEFSILQKEYIARVLHGSDIFRSSSPQEFNKFQAFLEERGPFSVVVDGLNVSYLAAKKTPNNRLSILKQAVEKLQARGRNGRVLVIGRQHMTKWSHYEFSAIKRMAEIFTLDNLTKDDGFFIYAALQSGLGTKVVSSDMLRDHLFRLGEVTLRETFRRWQRQHQILAVPNFGGIQLINPPSFSTTAQCHGANSWHIPYDDGTPRPSYQLPSTWLCTHAPQDSIVNQDIIYSETEVRSIPFTEEDTTPAPKKGNKQHFLNKKENSWTRNIARSEAFADFPAERKKQSHKTYNYSKMNKTKNVKKIVVSDLFKL